MKKIMTRKKNNIPFPKSLLFIGNKYRGTTVEKGRSLLIELNNILPPKSVNPSAYLNTQTI